MTYQKSLIAVSLLTVLPSCSTDREQDVAPKITPDMVSVSFETTKIAKIDRTLTALDRKDLLAELHENANDCVTKLSKNTASPKISKITGVAPVVTSYLNYAHLEDCIQATTFDSSFGHGHPKAVYPEEFARDLAETAIIKQIDQSEDLTSRDKQRVKSAFANKQNGLRQTFQKLDLCSALEVGCRAKKNLYETSVDRVAHKKHGTTYKP